MKNPNHIALALIAFLAPAVPTHAASRPGDVDASFVPGSSVNGPVYSIARQANGQVVVGGGLGGGVTRLNSDGGVDTNFLAVVSGAAEEVDSIVSQPDGKLIMGGYFTGVNGITRNGIARLNTNGSLDTAYLNGVEGSWLAYSVPPSTFYSYAGQVNSIALQSGTNAFIGGVFNRFNSVTHNGIVRLNSDGSVNANFLDHWTGSYPPSVFSTAVQPDGKVLIGGDFGIVRLNPDGHRDTNFITVVDQYVNTIVVQTDGKVLLGGNFTTVNGVGQNNLARVTAKGALDASFVATTDDRVFTIAVQPDNKVLIGGLFLSVNGEARSHIARLNASGSLDANFLNGQAGADGPVIAFAFQPDGGILIGGEFTTVNGVSSPYVARLYGKAPLSIDNFGMVANRFGFNISGEPNQAIVVEGSTNLVNWTPLQTNTLSSDSTPFTDSASTNFPKRFYRARLQ